MEDDVIEKITHCKYKLERYPEISEDKMLHYIHKLKYLPVSIYHLEATKVGRTVNSLRKTEGKVGEKARQLVTKWKMMVKEEEEAQRRSKLESAQSYEEEVNQEEEEDDDDEERYYIDENAQQEDENHYNHRTENGRRESEEEEPENRREEEVEENGRMDSEEEEERREDVGEAYDYGKIQYDTRRYSDEESGGAEYDDRAEVHREASEDERVEDYTNNVVEESASEDEDSRSKKANYYDGPEQSAMKYGRYPESGSKHSHEKTSKYTHYSEADTLYSPPPERSSTYEHNRSKDEELKYSHRDDGGKKRKKSTSSSEHSGRYSSPEKEPKLKKSENHRKHHKRKDAEKEESKKSRKSKKHDKSDRDKSHSSKDKERSQSKNEKSHEKKEKSHSERRRKSCDTNEKSGSNGHLHKDSKKAEDASTSTSSKVSKSTGDKKKEKVKSTDSGSSSQKEKKATLKMDDSVAGSSFADMLGCGDSYKKKKKKKKEERSEEKKQRKRRASSDRNSPVPNKTVRLLDAPPPEPLPPDITSCLAEPKPDYKPLPPRRDDDSPNEALDEELTIGLTKAKSVRSKVFCGRRKGFGIGKDNSIVPSLYEFCMRCLKENIDYLEYTGGVPFFILKPVFERATATQLLNLEHYNDYILEHTGYLWQKHCERDFRNKKREEMETYREMYLRCTEEREKKLQNLMLGIKDSYAKAAPKRQAKLAYVDKVAKPPRGVAKQQAKFGTGLPVGHEMKSGPPSKTSSRPTAPAINAAATAAATTSVPAPSSSRANATPGPRKPKIAPLMQKTLKFMKNRFRR